MNKKGVSPVIATVLLIAITIILGAIVFLWLRGMTEETVTKFDGENVKMVCEEVVFDASYSSLDSSIQIVNTGNVPIYQMKAKLIKAGSHSTVTLTNTNEWPALGLSPGGATSVSNLPSDINKIVLIPVLLFL